MPGIRVDRNLYPPAIGIGATAVTNLLQEFVIRKLTPHAQNPPITAAP